MVSAGAVRRTVTVVFCDLAGSTELGEQLDPEPLRLLLARWYGAMRTVVERHGGTVEKFIGDAVMAVFGVPHVHEDDALRAVRAAVEMRDAAAALGEGLEVRVGVNTGEVVVGDGETTLVTGDAVNTAKRLEQAAAAGEVLIGDATRALVAHAARLEPVADVLAKGKRLPVGAWRAVATIPGAPPVARRLDARLVGRRAELALLRAELERVERERSCRLVTVLGAAGIGKSRLASELLAEARPRTTVLAARCPPYGDGITFLPLHDLVRSAGGADAILSALADEPDAALVAERLADDRLRFLQGDEHPSTEEAFWAVRRVFETLAHARPLVVCLEDVHWAAPTFLDLLEYLVGWSRDAPILLLCLARPDLLDERPRLPGTRLELERLSDDEAAALLDGVAADGVLAPAARQRAVATAEGNPLFLEQLAAMLSAAPEATALPPTIEALLAARLDRLPAAERVVLERAAVVGRDFSLDAVLHLSSDAERQSLHPTLLRLVREQLVEPRHAGGPGGDGFRFRHALIRDVVYGSLAKAVRAELHERHGHRLGADGAEDELVAYHLEQAALCRRELRDPDDALAARAGDLLAAAGLRASARGDAAAALTLLRRSLALLPPAHERRPELLRELSAALWTSGDAEAAERTLEEAVAAARASGDVRLEWYGRLDRAAREASVRDDPAPLVAVAEQAVAVFEELGDDLGLARAYRRLGLVAFTAHRYADAAEACERALAHAEAAGDAQERARSADVLCAALLFGPARVEEAAARAERILGAARGNAVLEAHVSTALAGLYAMSGDAERAHELCSAAGDVYDELGLRLPRAGWSMVRASVERLAGDVEGALAALREGYDALAGAGHDGHRAEFAARLAQLLAEEGRHVEARALAAEASRLAGAHGRETSARLLATGALLADDPDEAAALARDGAAVAAETDDLNLQAELQLVLARLGESGAADAALRLYEAKGNLAAVRLAAAR